MAFRVCDGLTVNEPVWLSGCFFFEKKNKNLERQLYILSYFGLHQELRRNVL